METHLLDDKIKLDKLHYHFAIDHQNRPGCFGVLHGRPNVPDQKDNFPKFLRGLSKILDFYKSNM